MLLNYAPGVREKTLILSQVLGSHVYIELHRKFLLENCHEII